MIFLGTPQLCGGVDILFFFKVSFEKHPNVGGVVQALKEVGRGGYVFDEKFC